jgi:hypothetical protein
MIQQLEFYSAYYKYTSINFSSSHPINVFIIFEKFRTMIAEETIHLKFPIGPFTAQENISDEQLDSFINTIESAPADYRNLAGLLSKDELKKTYRDGSWNVQQLVNHVADMQLLHFFRMKKALTEPDYKEITLVNMDGWAQTPDGLSSPVADSLDMFEGVTKRFVYLMRSLNKQQHEISYYHPVRKVMLNQKQAISMSAWHVRHHLEHIKIALKG